MRETRWNVITRYNFVSAPINRRDAKQQNYSILTLPVLIQRHSVQPGRNFNINDDIKLQGASCSHTAGN